MFPSILRHGHWWAKVLLRGLWKWQVPLQRCWRIQPGLQLPGGHNIAPPNKRVDIEVYMSAISPSLGESTGQPKQVGIMIRWWLRSWSWRWCLWCFKLVIKNYQDMSQNSTSRCIAPSISWKAWISVNWGFTVYQLQFRGLRPWNIGSMCAIAKVVAEGGCMHQGTKG